MSKLKRGNIIDASIGSRVRARRKILGMNQSALATRLGVTFQMIQRYEYGACRISASMLYVMAQILRVPVSFFFEGLSPTGRESGTKAEPMEATPLEMTKTHHGRIVAAVFPRIPDRALQRAVAELMRAIAEDVEYSKRRELRSLAK